MRKMFLFIVASLISGAAIAESSTLDAAIGGALGGAAGAAIGNEVGGRDAAIAGGAIGAAVGAAVNTQPEARHKGPSKPTHYRHSAPPANHSGYFCPPGQAKKGRC